MATVSASAWSKPGAWALDSEENEAMERLQQDQREKSHLHYGSNQQDEPLADFPSLSAAVTTKTKKKKAQPLSLSEFQTGKSVTYSSPGKASQATQAKGLTTDELLILPTGPRERTAEELDRSSSRLGGGFGSYGNGRSRYSNGDDSNSNPRWGSSRASDEPRRNGGFNRENNSESAPSRADEIDDWGAAKKSMAAPAFERRERGGFFDSQSKADEAETWVSNKSFVPSEGRKFGGGFDNHRERRGGFEKEVSIGGGADSDSWGKKREEVGNVNGRPRLVLQPRTIPVTIGEQLQVQTGSGPSLKSKTSNPFGEARPREDVLAEKGQDWKKIEEDLESMKVKEKGSAVAVPSDSPSFGKKNFGAGNGWASVPEDKTGRNWRKADPVDVPTPSTEKADESVAEN